LNVGLPELLIAPIADIRAQQRKWLRLAFRIGANIDRRTSIMVAAALIRTASMSCRNVRTKRWTVSNTYAATRGLSLGRRIFRTREVG
jgi:hypothetical protein